MRNKGLLRNLLASTLLALMAACTFQIGWEQPPVANYQLTATIEALSTGNARLIGLLSTPAPGITTTPETTSIPQPFPQVTPTPLPPVFSNLRFSVHAEGEPNQSYFPAGTERIYAFWDYENLREGVMVRRVWYQEGRLISVRDDDWDTSRYGTYGTMKGVSIYNEDIGFPAGRYSLTLFIDGVEQAEIPPAQRSFWLIDPRLDSPPYSPDGTRRAVIQAAGRLFLEGPGGSLRLLDVFQEVSYLGWFPDGERLLVGERDRTFQTSLADDTGISHKLWIVDTESGDRHLIGGAGENFHSPSLSPDGSYIAVLAGSTRVETCRASPSMVILGLDQEFQRKSVFQIHDFTGLAPAEPPRYGIYPVISSQTFSWTATDRLEVQLWWSCPPSDQPPKDGRYEFNLTMMTAEHQ
jgi:hypothetical protein